MVCTRICRGLSDTRCLLAVWVAVALQAPAVAGPIETLAGAHPPAVLPATESGLQPRAITRGAGGRIVLAASDLVLEFSGADLLRIAGCGHPGSDGDGGPALDACVQSLSDVALGPDGSIWIADAGNFRVRRIDPATGDILTVAGDGRQGTAPPEGPALQASLGWVSSLSVGADGTLWIADSSHFVILRMAPGTGLLERAAGTGAQGFDGDDLPALASRLGTVTAIDADAGGNLWIADASNQTIRRLEAGTGILRTVAGGGAVSGRAADGGPATGARILPTALAVDDAGNLFLADALCSTRWPEICPDCASPCDGALNGDLLRRVDAATGVITTLAGGGLAVATPADPVPAAEANLESTRDISLSPSGEVWILDGETRRVRILDRNFAQLRPVALNGAVRYWGDGAPAAEALLSDPGDLEPVSDTALLAADPANDRVRRVDLSTGEITTVAGGGTPADAIGDGLPAAEARLASPGGIDLDGAGFLWIADTGNRRVRRVDALTGIIETLAGGAPATEPRADGGPALAARLIRPMDVLAGRDGDFWIADAGDGRVRRVAPDGVITTYAGGGVSEAEGIPSTDALLREPVALCFDLERNVLIADREAGRILSVDAATGTLRLIAGGGSPADGIGDGMPAVEAFLSGPAALFVMDSGDVLIAEEGAHRIRRVDAISGIISTLCGTGIAGFSPDGAALYEASVRGPGGVAAIGADGLVFADSGNHRIVRSLLDHDSFFSIEPPAGPIAGGLEARILGTGFVDGVTEVFFGVDRIESVVVESDTSLRLTIPQSVSPSHTVDVTVLTFPDRVLIAGGYTYANSPPAADPDPDDPDDGYTLLLGNDLVLNGAASSDPDLPFGDALMSFEWDLNGDGLTNFEGAVTSVTAADLDTLGLATPGVYPLTLTVTDSEGATDSRQTTLTVFTYEIAPLSGSINGGYSATISGLRLSGATGVRFGGLPASDLVVSEDRLHFTVPPGSWPPAAVPVEVSLPGEVLHLADAFQYLNDPPAARPDREGKPPGYTVLAGGRVVLDGAASSDPNEPAGDFLTQYEWDLDDDGLPDRRGAKVVLGSLELAAFGLDQPTERSLTLRVVDREGASSSAATILRVLARPTVFPNDLYTEWKGDVNFNKLDDRTESRATDERIDSVIIFEPGTDLEQAASRLAAVSPVQPVAIPAISAILLEDALVADVIGIVQSEPTLFRAEEEEIFEASLDTSCAAVKARDSALYSPRTATDADVLGRGINVAVLDSGVDDDHPALSGKFVAGFNAFTDTFQTMGSQSNPDDDFELAGAFHGTRTAGIICGSDATYRGVAPAAKLIDVKVLDNLGRGTSTSLLLGLQWCINHRDYSWAGQPAEHRGIDILNLSFNSSIRSDGKDAVSMMVDVAVSKGLVVVASSGNSAGLGSGFGPPAAADGAITVATLDDRGTVDRLDDLRAASSSYGPRADDGDADPIEELKPDVAAPGVLIRSPSGNTAGQPASGFVDASGSSLAAAHVSGVAALILEVAQDVDPATVKNLLRSTAEPRGVPYDLGLDRTYNIYYGCGIVDAFRALPQDLANANVVWAASLEADKASAIRPDAAASPQSTLQPGSPYRLGGGRQPHGIAVDGKGSVWLANRKTASVTKLNAAGQVLFHVLLGPPYGAKADTDVLAIAIDREGDAWVPLASQDKVVEIKADGTTPAATYATGSDPVAVAVDRDGNVWIANGASDDVTRLDATGTESAGSPFPVQTGPSALVCGRGGRVYVANRGANSVSILQGDGSLAGSYPAGTHPVEIALDFDGNIWVSNDLLGTVTRLDPDGSSPAAFAVGGAPRGISVAGDGTIWVSLYTLGYGNRVARLAIDGTVLERVEIPFAPVNRGDGTGFVHASSVDPQGDADGDGWSNTEEIDEHLNPFDSSLHPVSLTNLSPAAGSVSGGNTVTLQGKGLEPPLAVLFDGEEAVVLDGTSSSTQVEVPPGAFPPSAPVDVEVLRLGGVSDKLPAAYTYLNDPPAADADPADPDDGYTIETESPLLLDGSASADPNEEVGDSITLAEWTLNGHVVTGLQVDVSAADLVSYGMGDPGDYSISLRVEDSAGASDVATTTVHIVAPPQVQFVRGRTNPDGQVDIADVIFIVQWLFLGGPDPACLEAVNVNADSRIDIADAIYLVSYLFTGGPQVPPPFPACGYVEGLFGCESSTCQ